MKYKPRNPYISIEKYLFLKVAENVKRAIKESTLFADMHNLYDGTFDNAIDLSSSQKNDFNF